MNLKSYRTLNDVMDHAHACIYTDKVFKQMGLNWSKANWEYYQLVYSTYFLGQRLYNL